MAWYNLPQINNFGTYPDPVGNYPKPDINIIAPEGTPFTAPASGTVTSIDTMSFFGPSITVQFDNPPNSTAQYYAFNYLASIANSLHVGQHVNTGDILGYGGDYQNNSGGSVAFAFSAGPAYGKGPGWTENVIGTWINPALDPTNFLASLTTGSTGMNVWQSGCTCPKGYHYEKSYLGRKDMCVADSGNSSIVQSFPCGQNPAPSDQIAQIFGRASEWINDPIRVIKLIFAVLLIGGAIFLLASPQGQLMQTVTRFSKQAGLSRIGGK